MKIAHGEINQSGHFSCEGFHQLKLRKYTHVQKNTHTSYYGILRHWLCWSAANAVGPYFSNSCLIVDMTIIWTNVCWAFVKLCYKLRNVKERTTKHQNHLIFLYRCREVLPRGLRIKLPRNSPRTRKIAFHTSMLLVCSVRQATQWCVTLKYTLF